MVINSTSTIELENIAISVPSNRIQSQSIPSKSPHRSRKRRVHRQIFVPDKPVFVNYASAYINPYRSLSPTPVNHHYRRFKRTKRKKQVTTDQIHSNENQLEGDFSSSGTILDTTVIDLWPLDANGFNMDFIRKRQMAIDNTFDRERIKAWKPASFNHLITLIRELIKEKNLVEQVWIIYYWIAQNISYEIDANEQTTEEIFRSSQTNSDGYAILFQTLCETLALKCVQITGYVKDSHFQINQSAFSRLNHTWNAVKLEDNRWYLLDCAWGSGSLNNQQPYQKYLQTFYFLTRPEQLIYTHLPKDPQWQLLTKPISMSDYLRLPYLHSYYFIYDLTIVSPRFTNIILFDSAASLAEVLIQAPKDIQLACTSENEDGSSILTQYDASRQIWQCLFTPYQSGFHTLMIYANRVNVSNSLMNAIELGVEIPRKEFPKRTIFPITFGKFLEHRCQIFSPLDGVLKRGRKIAIHCRIPNASYGRITVDGVWLEEVMIKEEIFRREIIVPEREIVIYAQFRNEKFSNIYYGLIRYLVEK